MDWSWLTHNYLTRGFWGDEAWTAGISKLSIPNIITVTGQDFHPPLYYFFVHFVGGIFGFSEVPIRLISVFFFLLVPVTVYFLTRLLWNQQKKLSPIYSLLSSLLVLLSPILITYAFEARSYGLLAFESVFSAYVFWRAKDEIKGQYTWRILYFLLGGAMVYTHYYAWFVLLSHAVYLLIADRKKILPMLPAALGVLVVQLPWLPTLLHQTGSVKDSYWIGAINSRTHLEFFMRVTGGDVDSPYQKPLAWIVGMCVLIGLIYRLLKKRIDKEYVFMLSWLIVPTLIPTIISFVFAPVFFYRYLIFTAIPLLILTVDALRQIFIKSRLPLIALAIIIGWMSFRVDWQIFTTYPRSMRETVQELYQQKVRGDGPIYTVLPAFAEVLQYFGNQDHIIVTTEGLVQFSGKSLLDEYVKLGKVEIADPPASAPYWFLTPNKTVQYIQPN